MTGVRRRQGRFSAHLLYALSVFALLAFASFPVAAAADSSNIQYSDAPPTATGKESAKETPAKSSKAKNGGSTNPSNTPGSKESHSSEEESPSSTSSKSDAVPVVPSHGGGNGGSGPQGTQRSGSKGAPHSGSPQGGSYSSKPAVATKDKGSDSSPLIPILIAIAVLAAISIGAVMIRQRRQRGGGSAPSISPKAG